MNEPAAQKQKKIPIVWNVPETVVSRYAMNFIAQKTPDEVIISFFETTPPILLGSEEERRAMAEKIDYVEARCVARIILNHTKAQQLIDVLKMNVSGQSGTLDEPEDLRAGVGQ